MSRGEGRSEAGNPAVSVAASVVVLNDLSQPQPHHLREGLSEVSSLGAAEVSAIEVGVALGVAVGDSAVVETSVATEEAATALVMIVGGTVIEVVDLAAIGVAVDFVEGLVVVVMVV